MVVELLLQGAEALRVQGEPVADPLQQRRVAEAAQAVIEGVADQVGQDQQNPRGIGVQRPRGHQGAGDHGHGRPLDHRHRQDDGVAILAQQGDGVRQEEMRIENRFPPFGASESAPARRPGLAATAAR